MSGFMDSGEHPEYEVISFYKDVRDAYIRHTSNNTLPELRGGIDSLSVNGRTRDSVGPRLPDEAAFSALDAPHESSSLSIAAGVFKVQVRETLNDGNTPGWSVPDHIEVVLTADFDDPIDELFDQIVGVLREDAVEPPIPDGLFVVGGANTTPEPAPVRPFRVFIAHGNNPAWGIVARILTETHGIPVEAFERQERAGQFTGEAVRAMIGGCDVAVVIMTAEDEMADGTKRARENVVHELGVSQGMLGIQNTIILLEDGTSEPSNIHGVTQIRFAAGDVLGVEDRIVEALLARRDQIC